jgi:hypothetical protein
MRFFLIFFILKAQQYEQQPQQAQPQPQSAPQEAAPPSQTKSLLGVAFSPANEVSQVKYTSEGFKYNF